METYYLQECLYEELIQHCQTCLPYEACGFIAGENNIISGIYPLVNEAKTVNRFFVRKEIVHQTLLDITNANKQVLAVYHSHPSTHPHPSQLDLYHHPDDHLGMVILSFQSTIPTIKWYKITNKTSTPCSLVILKEDHS